MEITHYDSQIYDSGIRGRVRYVASVKELEGCITQGDSLTELFVMIQDAIESWLDTVAE